MKVDRLISIIMILLDKKRISAQELADEFEVSIRTIYRDIDAIDLAGIPIRSTPGVGGGFEIMPRYKVDKSVFSTKELSTILMGLKSLSNMNNSEELIHALKKVESLIPPEKENEISLKTNQIHIDLSSWFGNSHTQTYLEIIKQGIEQNRILSFQYRDRYGELTERHVEPYQLVLKGHRWYWHGYCLNRKDFRIFRMSRMTNLKLTNDSFAPKPLEQPSLNFDEKLKTMQTTITLHIHRSLMDRVLDYCPFENFKTLDDSHFEVQFPFIENDYYYNTILGFGPHCECVSPEHIRVEIKQRLQTMISLY